MTMTYFQEILSMSLSGDQEVCMFFCQEVKSHEASSQPTVQNAGSCTFPTPFNLACVRGIMLYYQNAKYVYLEESKWERWSSSSFLLLLIFYSDRMGKKVSWFIFTQEKKKILQNWKSSRWHTISCGLDGKVESFFICLSLSFSNANDPNSQYIFFLGISDTPLE